jgi:histidinol-phosphate aminotransferase
VPREQIEKVAAFTGWRPDGTLIGNGSNELLQLLFTSVLERGKSAVISQPTFTLYKILARGLGADVHEVYMSSDFRFDVDKIIDAARKANASLIVLCSPNNPTGTCLKEEEVVRIIESTNALVVLDEAYVQFAAGSLVELLKAYNRLVILQTFSKAMGAAGLRFGYSLADPALTAELNKVRLPYAVNIFTLIAAEVLIDRWDQFNKWIGVILKERELMKKSLRQIPHVRVYDSGANFLLFETLIKSPHEVFESLLAKGILIRDVSSYPMLDRGLRVSIGSPSENAEFLAVLKEVV